MSSQCDIGRLKKNIAVAMSMSAMNPVAAAIDELLSASEAAR